MSGWIWTLTLSALYGSSVVSGVLNGPRNVRLTSHNMNLVLRWDPPLEGVSGSPVYTAEYKTSVSAYAEGCVNVSGPPCDLTHRMHPPITENGKYTGRVRVQLGSQSSAWEQSGHLVLDRDTAIGSPKVTLLSNGATLEVRIEDPPFVVSALRSVYIFASYNVSYWKDEPSGRARHVGNVRQNWVVLNQLEPWTKYCVQVQIHTERNPRPSEPSAPVCTGTTNEEEAPWLAAVGAFVLSAVAVALVLVAVVYRRSISGFLCPKDSLPQHFREYLRTSPNSSVQLAMHSFLPPEETYHPLSIVADGGSVEREGPPLWDRQRPRLER